MLTHSICPAGREGIYIISSCEAIYRFCRQAKISNCASNISTKNRWCGYGGLSWAPAPTSSKHKPQCSISCKQEIPAVSWLCVWGAPANVLGDKSPASLADPGTRLCPASSAVRQRRATRLSLQRPFAFVGALFSDGQWPPLHSPSIE